MRRAEINGGLEIRAHAHGKFREPVSRRNFRKQRKMRPGWLIHRRNAHQAGRLQPVFFPDADEKIIDIGRSDPGFLVLLASVDLKQQFRRTAQAIHGLAQSAGKPFPVQNLDHIEQSDRVLGLVGLKRSDQAEFKIRMTPKARNPVFLGFLNPVFAENSLTGVHGLIDSLIGLALTDGGQGHSGKIAALRLAARGDPVEKGGAPGGNTVWEVCHAR